MTKEEFAKWILEQGGASEALDMMFGDERPAIEWADEFCELIKQAAEDMDE